MSGPSLLVLPGNSVLKNKASLSAFYIKADVAKGCETNYLKLVHFNLNHVQSMTELEPSIIMKVPTIRLFFS